MEDRRGQRQKIGGLGGRWHIVSYISNVDIFNVDIV
jgi:hypothetical protein